MTKATHQGHCQICDAIQKLPRGRLALHGYTTRWGFFSGTCTGARALPFEVSKDLIDDAIAGARARAAALAAEAAAVEAATETVWVNERTRNNRGSYDYAWRELNTADVHGIGGNPAASPRGLCWTGRDGKPRNENAYALNMQSVIQKFNAARARLLRESAKQLSDYADWQARRIAKWAPAPLIELDD